MNEKGMNQREYLINFEKLCGVKKPIFLDTMDTWKIFDNDLAYAKDLKTEHSIGRQRLSFRNSEICEVWIDVDNHEGIPFKQYKEERLAPAIQKLNSLGISNDCIFPKVSGTGVHLHVFVSDLPTNADVNDLFQKTATENVDQRSVVEKQRIREYGAYASTKNGFTGWVSVAGLLKAKTLPTFKEPVYPELKLFKCNPEFMFNISLVKEDKAQEKMEHEPIVDYERDGDFMLLFKCPLITNLDRRARTDHHLRHDPRVFLITQFIHFGEPSRKKLHEIISQCSDYSQELTQGFMDHAMQNGYHPETCARAKELKLGCPDDCKGSGGKSPIKFAWTALSLEEVKQEFRKILLLNPEDDDVLDISLAQILDVQIEGDLAWTFLVAPPSWAKTVIITAVHNPKWSDLIEEVTDKTFISGKTKYDPVLKQDVPIEPLLPKLHMKTFICKEFTSQLMQGKDIRNSVFAQLRGIYDCNYSKAFGSFDYKLMPEQWKHVRMGFFAGCTLYIDKYSTLSAMLGERYLKIRMKEPDRLAAIKHARLHTQEHNEMIKLLSKKVTRFIANLTLPKKFEQPSEEIGNALDYLAEFIVQTRAPVDKTPVSFGGIEYEYDDLKELGTRMVKQLLRKGWALSVLYGTEFDKNIYRIIFRHAMDTLLPNRKILILYMYQQKEPIDKSAITKDLLWGHNRRDATLRDLQLIGVITENENGLIKLNEKIRTYLKIAMSPLPSRTQLSKGMGSITSPLLRYIKYMYRTSKSSDRDGLRFNWRSHRSEIAPEYRGFDVEADHHHCPCYPCIQKTCDVNRGCPAYRRWLRRGVW